MTDIRTFERVKQIIAEGYDVNEDKINLAAHLQDDLNLDSLDRVELTMEIEKAFDITIPDEDIENIATVGQIVEYLQARIKTERRFGVLKVE